MAPYCTACDALPFEGGCSTLNNETGGSSHRSEASSSPLSICPKTQNYIRLRSFESEPSTTGVCWPDFLVMILMMIWFWQHRTTCDFGSFPPTYPPSMTSTPPIPPIASSSPPYPCILEWSGMVCFGIEFEVPPKKISWNLRLNPSTKTLNPRSIFFSFVKSHSNNKKFSLWLDCPSFSLARVEMGFHSVPHPHQKPCDPAPGTSLHQSFAFLDENFSQPV